MWANPQFSTDLFTFVKENRKRKLHFLCSVTYDKNPLKMVAFSQFWPEFVTLGNFYFANMLSQYKLQKTNNRFIENNVIFQKFKDTVLRNYTNSKKGNWLKLYQSKSLFVDNNNNNNNNDNNINNNNNNISNDNNSSDANDDFSLQSNFK